MGAAQLVERLTALAERQREAAVVFDVSEIEATTRARADLLFELNIRLERGLGEQELAEVRELLPAYQRAEKRLSNVVGAVALALKPPPGRIRTYGRRGALRGR